MHAHEKALLTPAEMARADRAAIAAGVAGVTLMESAGRAVAETVMARWSPCRVVVLCGPGNNGGDGFVAARHLAAAGWPVRIGLLGARDKLAGDAAHHAASWREEVAPLDASLLDHADLVIDAVFGAGLSRAVEGEARVAIDAMATRRLPIIAVDVPSGVDGGTGEVRGAAAPAAVTVTFFPQEARPCTAAGTNAMRRDHCRRYRHSRARTRRDQTSDA